MNSAQGRDYEDNATALRKVINDIERRSKSGERFVGVKTGLINIDMNTQGLERKTNIFIIY